MNNSVEIIGALCYKFCMFGVPIDVPTNILCDNGVVFENMARPYFTLTKKHRSIYYHCRQEAVAVEIVRVFKEHMLTNLDCFLPRLWGDQLGKTFLKLFA